MPISSQLFVRSTLALLAVGLVALLAIVGTVIYLGERSQVYFNDVLEARDVRTAAVDLRNALRVAESGQRGFIVSGEEIYLENYERAKEVMPLRYETLKAMLSADQAATPALDELKQTIDEKISEMDQTIALERAGNHDEAVAVIRTDRGKDLMDNAIAFLTSVITNADQRQTDGVTEQRNNADWLRWVSVIGGIMIIVVVGGSALTVWNYTKELVQARDEVNALNAELEERVRLRTADLVQANDEIQRFAYIVTHDLRAPLVNIMGFTSELEESVRSVQALIERESETGDDVSTQARLAATEDLPEAIGFIRSSTKKMDGLINAILRLSREGRRVLKAERIDVKQLIEAGVSSVAHQIAEADGEIEIDVNVPTISSDRLSIEQAVGNLLDNAVKYRAKDRPLRIKVRGGVAPGQIIVLDFEDNGRGIAEQDKERVFELFRRSGAQDQPGEGIGLAFVRTVVRNLGGDITMTSVLGEGTTFRVTLPRTLKTGSTSA
jgi:signal transduction histidine kinase